jgi:CO/xanthine dehydrogenase Mo-binding subunit
MAVETVDERQGPEPAEQVLDGVLVHAQAGPGRITGIDAAAARTAGAVVLTGQDTLGIDPYHGPVLRDRPLLAIDRIRYRGEPVAAVAAESPEAARAAAALVQVRIAPLPAAVTGARAGDEPLVHLTDLLRRGALADQAPLAPGDTNLLAMSVHPFGPTDAPDFPNRTVVVEKPARVDPEPMQATARWEDGALTIWTINSEPEAVQRDLAELFELEPGQVRVIAREPQTRLSLPGSLGIEAIAAALARRARTAVRLTADPADFGWAGPRARLHISGHEALLSIDAGAVAGYLPIWLEELSGSVSDAYGVSSVTAQVIYSEQPPIAATLAEWQQALVPPMPRGSDGKPAEENEARGAV